MISRLLEAKGISNAEHGFAMQFSDEPFSHDIELIQIKPKEASRAIGQPVGSLPAVGTWYSGNVAGEKLVAWLCPALYEYFGAAPKRLFVKTEKLPIGVDLIWHIGSNDPQAHRYMSAECEAR